MLYYADASIILTTHLVGPPSPCLSKHYINAPILAPSRLRLLGGAVLNPAIVLSKDTFILLVHFLTSNTYCTTATDIVLYVTMHINIF